MHSIGVSTYQALDLAIAEAYSQVGLKDFPQWFAHFFDCILSILKKASIDNFVFMVTQYLHWQNPNIFTEIIIKIP